MYKTPPPPPPAPFKGVKLKTIYLNRSVNNSFNSITWRLHCALCLVMFQIPYSNYLYSVYHLLEQAGKVLGIVMQMLKLIIIFIIF